MSTTKLSTKNVHFGFTLIELIIVITIIAIIAAIAIPALLRSRLAAQETSAIATLRSVATAQAQVQAQTEFADPTTGVGLYGSFVEFQTLDPSPLDSSIITAPHTKSGYVFAFTFDGQTQDHPEYQAFATPLRTDGSQRIFYIDPSGVVRFTRDGSVPTSDSNPVE